VVKEIEFVAEEIELVVEMTPEGRDGSGVGQHAHATSDFGRVTTRDVGRVLVASRCRYQEDAAGTEKWRWGGRFWCSLSVALGGFFRLDFFQGGHGCARDLREFSTDGLSIAQSGLKNGSRGA
jgi:hypothetical protein